jgi:diguanylate cyclase (GGDEF)-like protein
VHLQGSVLPANQNQKKIQLILAFGVFIVVVVSGFLTISDLAGKQSQQHQQSISPVFTLIEKQLIEPLQIATTLADVGVYDEYFLSDSPDKESLMAQLQAYEERFDLLFYLAHEKSRKQFNSDGSDFDLIEGEVYWYFELKEQTDSRVQAVLGKREDVHLYIDVRKYDIDDKFLGFVGVGKSLADFLSSFEAFRASYGHEFLFVNNNDEIVLSSLPELSPEEAELGSDNIVVKTTDDVVWYQDFVEQTKQEAWPSALVTGEKGDLLVSKLDLQSLNWSLYILTPLDVRQQQVNQSFAIYLALGLLFTFIGYKVFYRFGEAYINNLSRRGNQDSLTGLANKEYARVFFNRMRKRERQIAVIVADVDDFGVTNDELGHNAGNELIKAIAEVFLKKTRKHDLVARWKDEEFILVLPNTTSDEAFELAESYRKCFEMLPLPVANTSVKLTLSFGCSASRNYADTLDVLIERADRAMCKSKERGKNCVTTSGGDTE